MPVSADVHDMSGDPTTGSPVVPLPGVTSVIVESSSGLFSASMASRTMVMRLERQ